MDSTTQPLEICTTWGTIVVQVKNNKVMGCSLPRLDVEPAVPFSVLNSGKDPISAFVRAALHGKETKVPELGQLKGSPFQWDVWRAISTIPNGQTKTYGQLATYLGKPTAYRAVANACGANPAPLFIPCHRVVGANNNMGGFSAGIAWKHYLLTVEK
jgi:O-6-methylguanine DNA methyltransferase